MFILKMFSDYGYDGSDDITICVSESYQKLVDLSNIIAIEYKAKQIAFSALSIAHNAEWESKRANVHRRGEDEISVWQNKVENLFKSFTTLSEYNIATMPYSEGVTVFNITEIKVLQ